MSRRSSRRLDGPLADPGSPAIFREVFREISGDGTRLRALALWLDGAFVEDYEYALPGTPCEAVVGEERELFLPDRVETEFEGDIDLRGLLGISGRVDPGYQQIRVNVRVEGEGTPAQLDELVEIARTHSPVFDTLRRPVDFQVQRVA